MSSSIFAALLWLLLPAALFGQDRADDRRAVVLITIGPGDEIYEKFGHNFIWVHDPAAGTNACYNWGLFSFDDPDFIPNFVRGKLDYAMGGAPIAESIGGYEVAGRRATFQRVPMTSSQIDDLVARCETNLRPKNRFYRYDPFTDNCSTRVRDMLDAATQGKVRATLDDVTPKPPVTQRQHTLRLMQDNVWASLGIDFSLGPKCDRVLSAWDEAFLPGRLSEGLGAMTTRTWAPWRTSRPPEPATVPDRTLPLAAVGFAAAAGVIAAVQSGRREVRGIGYAFVVLWWLLAGVGGMYLTGMWAGTDHTVTHANQNLPHFSPLALGLLVLFVIQRRHAKADDRGTGFQPVFIEPASSFQRDDRREHAFKPRARQFVVIDRLTADALPGRRAFLLRWGATAVLGISCIAMLAKAVGLLGQDNWRMILLALPLNVAAAWAAWRVTSRLTAAAPADEVARP